MILCLTGMPGSGKSTAADIFAKMGFDVIEGSAIIKEEMRKKGIEVTSESVEVFANKVKSEKGKAAFAIMTGEKVREAVEDHNILVVGMRSTAEFEAMERAAGSRIPLIEIIAPTKTRFKRLSERKVLGIKTQEIFILKDKSNISQGMPELLEKADYVISNTGSKTELKESIHELLENMKEVE
jgi:dephospho-CoA kinase